MTKQQKVLWIFNQLAQTVVASPTSADYFRSSFFQILLPNLNDSNDDPTHPVLDNLIRKYCQLSGVTEPAGINPTI